QWALYYPPATYFRTEEFPAGPGWQGMVRNSIESYMKGDYQNAFDAIKGVPNDIREPRFFAYRASLLLAVGRVDEAGPDLERALTLDPKYSDALALQSIIAVVQNHKDKALALAGQAVEADQDDYLPRLGLGLAKIREGDLQEGRREIEIAASLDPNNSIVRSYLGKAYYEEKRGPLDEREYAIAKELDPKDPTPWFYDAIAKQTTNRPVEALQDIQKAIELNDNRAVYRSSLQLDSDLAARSASLGRI